VRIRDNGTRKAPVDAAPGIFVADRGVGIAMTAIDFGIVRMHGQADDVG